ncbi:hypothetical protein HDU86_007992 [Geranomyces michiganensis]|nr:hypothetical protein HDU86_007992 [Geranomyces michiganensis]
MAIASWTGADVVSDSSHCCVRSYPSSPLSPTTPLSPPPPPSPPSLASCPSSSFKASMSGFTRYPEQQQQRQQQQQQPQYHHNHNHNQQQQQQQQQEQQHQQRRRRVSPPAQTRQLPIRPSPSKLAQSSASLGPCLSTTAKPAVVGRFACEFVHRTWPGNDNSNNDGVVSAAGSKQAVHSSFVAFVSRVVRTSGISSAIIFLALLYVMRAGKMSPISTTTTTTTTTMAAAAVPSALSSSSSGGAAPQNGAGSTLALAQARLFTAAIILAQKITDDNRYTNKTWSELSGFALLDVNRMEAELLARIGFSLHVPALEFSQWVRQCAVFAALVGIELGEKTMSIKTTTSASCRHQQQQNAGRIPLPMLPSACPTAVAVAAANQHAQAQLLPAYYRKRKSPPYDRERHSAYCNKIPRNDPAAFNNLYAPATSSSSACPQQTYHSVQYQPVQFQQNLSHHHHHHNHYHPHHQLQQHAPYPIQFRPVVASHNVGYDPAATTALLQQQQLPPPPPPQPTSFGYYHPHFATMPRAPATAATAVGVAGVAVPPSMGYAPLRRASYAQS